MKIITLNTWGGRAGKKELLSFFEKHKDDTDVFCLQEILSGSYTDLDGKNVGGVTFDENSMMNYGVQDISQILSDHVGYFRPHFKDKYGLMMFVRKNLNLVAEGEVFVYREKGYIPEGDIGNHARNIQYITLLIENEPITIINFHGIWNGKGKTDTDDRINQSQNIINFIKSLNGECVLCGDFNLLPNTKSIQMFEDAGLINLIKKYNITSTRTSFYTKPEKFADYIFVTNKIEEKYFNVLPDEVSDHSPLFLEIL